MIQNSQRCVRVLHIGIGPNFVYELYFSASKNKCDIFICILFFSTETTCSEPTVNTAQNHRSSTRHKPNNYLQERCFFDRLTTTYQHYSGPPTCSSMNRSLQTSRSRSNHKGSSNAKQSMTN